MAAVKLDDFLGLVLIIVVVTLIVLDKPSWLARLDDFLQAGALFGGVLALALCVVGMAVLFLVYFMHV